MSFKSCKACTAETGRYPGCHDHCDKYAKEKAEWERNKAIRNANNEVQTYTCLNIIRVRDSAAKREFANRGRRWFRR